MLTPGAAHRRILLGGLSEMDARRLEVFLVLRSERLRQEWRIVTEGPVDVYLHDADEPPTIPGSLDRPPHQVRVMDGDRADPDDLSILRRPLQYEAFVDILAAIEQQMPGAAPRVPTVPATHAARAMHTPPAAAPAVGISLANAPDGLRFRLKRWPGADLLNSVHQGLRLASFITVRHLSVGELSQLSGVDRQSCSAFLNTMMANDLLRAEPVRGIATPASPPTRPNSASARPDRAVLSSLRAKLGIRTEGR